MHQRKWNVNTVEYFRISVDNRGNLIPIDFDELPFTPKRVFIVNSVPQSITRGQHAHKQCKQVILCLTGEVWIITYNGEYVPNILFPGQAIYIPPMIWCSQVFYDNGNIEVFASEKYDEDDYIRNFQEYSEIV